jgi:hypothetical protein
MTYPYGTKGAPVVGNGLGGLPRRTVAAAAAAVSALTPVYTFSQLASATRNTDTPLTNPGSFVYFDDSNIFWNSNFSTQGVRATFNRSAGTITLSNQESIQPGGINISGCIFDINVSNTFVVASNNGRTATRSGNTMALGFVAPQSGTLTIGGAAYSVNEFIVRSAPDGSVFVAFVKDSNTTSGMNVFVFSPTFVLLRSFRFTATQQMSSSLWEIVNGVINNDGVFIVCNRSTAGGNSVVYNSYAINLLDGSVLSTASFTILAAPGGSITGNTFVNSYFDYSSNTFILQAGFTDGSFHYPYAYSVRYNSTTQVFTHFDGSTGINQSRGIVASGYQSVLYFNSFNPIRSAVHGGTTVIGYSKFGIPYSQFCSDAASVQKRKVPMVAPSINNDLLGFTITKPVIDRESLRAVPMLSLVANGDYQGTYTNPSDGFLLTHVSTHMIYIGDDLFLTMQQTANATGSVTCTIIKRTVTFS